MSENTDFIVYIILSVGLLEVGGKLSIYNDSIGLIVGFVAIFLFWYAVSNLYNRVCDK